MGWAFFCLKQIYNMGWFSVFDFFAKPTSDSIKPPTEPKVQRTGVYMISEQELNPHAYSLTSEQAANLPVLLDKINQIRTAYAVPMTVTSGLRSMADQLRINPSAPKSMHLRGAACDILDSDGKLKEWIKANESLLESIGLWCEAFASTPNWVHFQIFAPKSGNRFFNP